VSLRVLVADDQALVRGAFRMLIDSAPDLHVVAEAGDGLQAVDLALVHQPDIVLMDIRMPRLDGIEAARRILAARKAAETRVLMLTTFALDRYVFGALRAGASGFLLKDIPPAELLEAIRIVAAGDALLAPSVTRQLIEEFVNRSPGPAYVTRQLEGVTDREREVLTLIGRGMSNAELAEHLHITIATAKTHVSRVLAKLGARDRAQLVIAAYEAGLVGR
jgi:DNA-binding NarL/FixJ family response regulator